MLVVIRAVFNATSAHEVFDGFGSLWFGRSTSHSSKFSNDWDLLGLNGKHKLLSRSLLIVLGQDEALHVQDASHPTELV